MQLPKRAGCTALMFLLVGFAHAQPKFLKKAANAANNAINNAVNTAVNGNSNNNNTGNDAQQAGQNSSSTRSGRPSNRGGQGLVSTPPDVAANLTASEDAFKKSSYGEARYALQQAMLGVELQIGHGILKMLPEQIAGMPKEAEADQVTSTGWGWAGLTIRREYQKDDKAMDVTIANNSVMLNALNMYLASGMYNQSTGGQQNWKQTKLKNNKAVIEYSDGSGYKLSVPLGQTTLLLLEGVNFATEQEFMNAANTIDVDKIKELLNEK
ncbi:hypothetical protein [Paracnuella aquatica]|uniref:hypothetical protein n=1 Tax=Paracnuella aquatica TaxID=2268757 RepID=UPI000DEF7677|nr:hypothetical protein [Paracnuella aquatica]RPD51309.1 hypothetical protein DRJ53_01100 [Paracnuella aquatica]